MVGKIEKTFGAEVFVSDTYKICIQQEQDGETETLIFSPTEIPGLINLLQEAVKEAERVEQEELDNA